MEQDVLHWAMTTDTDCLGRCALLVNLVAACWVPIKILEVTPRAYSQHKVFNIFKNSKCITNVRGKAREVEHTCISPSRTDYTGQDRFCPYQDRTDVDLSLHSFSVSRHLERAYRERI